MFGYLFTSMPLFVCAFWSCVRGVTLFICVVTGSYIGIKSEVHFLHFLHLNLEALFR